MNARAERGKELAEKVNIRPVGKGERGKWIVPSSTGNGRYLVDLNSTAKRCSCPDYELHRFKCKHIYAVEFAVSKRIETQTDSRGQTVVTETVIKTRRTTYKQNWPAYNAAQTGEKATFQVLLHDLCSGIKEPEQTMGRPRYSQADLIFCAAFKVYCTLSARRFATDLEEAHQKGYLAKTPHFSTLFRCLESRALTPVLEKLIERSSSPLRVVETEFAVDSSGFSTCRTVTWFNTRYGHAQDNQDWIKLHLICGVTTNIVTGVMISGRYDHDSLAFAPLVAETARRFAVSEVSADKAYSSRNNLHLVGRYGGTAYIPFKSNAVGTDKKVPDATAEACRLWKKMFHLYNLNRDEFLTHYHKRSNIESTFAMIKAKFGGSLRCKTDVAIENEALCKVLCHNICCVIQSMHEFGIEPTFATQSRLVAKVTRNHDF